MSCLSKEFSLEHFDCKCRNETSIEGGRMGHERNIDVFVESRFDDINFPSTSFFCLIIN